MNYRKLGRTGLEVSELGFGAAPLGIRNYLGEWDPALPASRKEAVRTLHAALDLGINYWDTAPGYGDGASEEILGEALRGRRDRVVVATKVGGVWSFENVVASAEESLRRLRTDCIDVFQFHGGHYERKDVIPVLGGGMEAMMKLREQGKIRFIGLTSEGGNTALEELLATGLFDTLQIRYNFCYQHPCDHINERAGVMYQAEDLGMGIITMRTMTSGLFARSMTAGFGDSGRSLDANAFCLNWVLSNPLVDVALVGMRHESELLENVATAEKAERFDLAALHHRFV